MVLNESTTDLKLQPRIYRKKQNIWLKLARDGQLVVPCADLIHNRFGFIKISINQNVYGIVLFLLI